MSTWQFEVKGTPRPKGSWTAYGRGKRFLFKDGERYYRLRDVGLKPNSDKMLAQWVNAIQWAAKAAGPPKQPLDGPWSCHITFWFRPPQSRIGQTWAIGKKLEDNGSTTNCGDEDKLRRAVLDALEGIFWVNDRHVCDGGQTKLYCANRDPGALIVVKYLENEQLCLP